MSMRLTPTVLGFGLREGARFIWDKLLFRPSRPRQVLQYLRDNTPAGDPAATLAAMDEFARQRRFLMNVGDVKGRILGDALVESAAGQVLELGTYCAYSAILMAHQLDGQGHVDSLESNAEYAAAAREIIEHAGLSAMITVHVGAAAELLPGMDKQYNLVFVDHWKDLYLPDLLLIEASGLVGPGSVVVADNIGMFDSAAYLEHVRGCGRYDSRHHETHMEYYDTVYDAVEVSVMRS